MAASYKDLVNEALFLMFKHNPDSSATTVGGVLGMMICPPSRKPSFKTVESYLNRACRGNFLACRLRRVSCADWDDGNWRTFNVYSLAKTGD